MKYSEEPLVTEEIIYLPSGGHIHLDIHVF
jgi:hypothetical protein